MELEKIQIKVKDEPGRPPSGVASVKVEPLCKADPDGPPAAAARPFWGHPAARPSVTSVDSMPELRLRKMSHAARKRKGLGQSLPKLRKGTRRCGHRTRRPPVKKRPSRAKRSREGPEEPLPGPAVKIESLVMSEIIEIKTSDDDDDSDCVILEDEKPILISTPEVKLKLEPDVEVPLACDDGAKMDDDEVIVNLRSDDP